MHIIWSKRYSVGVDAIDAQHKGVVDMINLLYGAIGKKDASEEIKTVIVAMANHAQEHFQHEERLMRAVEFPGLHLHQKAHGKLNKDLHSVLVKMRKGEVPTARQLFAMLRSWWVEHVEIEDMKYAQWIKDRQTRGELSNLKELVEAVDAEKVQAL